MKLSDALSAACEILLSINCRFAVVGGLGASARGEARFTRDVDIALSVDSDEAAEQIIHAFSARGYAIVATVEQKATGRLATARLQNQSGIICDLVFATCGVEAEVVDSAESLELFPDLHVPVATVESLIAMKTLSCTKERPRDLGDIQAMLKASAHFDEEKLIELLHKIQERGYSRGRDLLEKWTLIRS